MVQRFFFLTLVSLFTVVASLVTPTAAQAQTIYRRCGANTNFTTQAGITWLAENPAHLSAGTSTVRTYTTPVVGTTEDALYQTQREGSSFSYAIPVANGTYNVGVWYSELGYTTVGNRSFRVTVEGVVGINGFDPFAAIGLGRVCENLY